jgi:hypothetical protein
MLAVTCYKVRGYAKQMAIDMATAGAYHPVSECVGQGATVAASARVVRLACCCAGNAA